MKKIFIIAALMLLCVGCEAQYNVEIKDDGTVKETLRAIEDKDFFEEYEKSSTGRVVSFILEPYLNELNNNKYEVKNDIAEDHGGVVITRNYSSIETYINSTILSSQFTDKVNFEKDSHTVTITAKGAFSKDEQNQDKIPVDEGIISITIPYKVKEHNADRVDGNTYIWEFSAVDSEDEELKIVYDDSKLSGKNNYLLIGTIGGIIILLVGGFLMYNVIRSRRANANKI